MKTKISISIDEELIRKIEKIIENGSGKFRNKSHMVEYSIKKLMENGGEYGG
ncbi:MAG: hypothetical protein WD876_00065 [Candidatus Pacearchaeota archaeon]